jgi:hypothetical protein
LTIADGDWRDHGGDSELQQPDQTDSNDEEKQRGQALCCVCDEWEPLDATLHWSVTPTTSGGLARFIRG